MLQWTCQFRRGRWLKKEIKREPTVHFDEQLIERLICLRVSPEVRSGSLAPYSVDLVDEKNAGSVLASLLEHPAHLEITPGWFRVSNAGSDPSHLSRPGGGGVKATRGRATYPGRSNADEHFKKFGSADSDEGDAGLARGCFCQ